MEFGVEWVAALVVVLTGVAGAAMVLLRRRREGRDARALAEATARNLHIPASLHPVIDPDICIGSLSCLQACPEGDILGVVDGAARLIRGSNCIGHGRCALECPVGAIRLVFGTSERGVDLPEVDEFFESSRPGVHVIGELGGMGLIKNAVSQGLQVAGRLSEVVAPGAGEAVDAVIVGAGPAGLACAVGLHQAGRTFRVLEQNSLGGTIAQYPRQKVVMTEPVEVPGYGKLGKSLISKEELLGTWQKVLAKTGIQVDEGVKVTGLQGEDGAFEVQTDQGLVLARKVVLACGRRGSPRKLGVPGEDQAKVTYRLISPEQYEGCKVMVVGGGDSALEAAIQLCEETDAEVALSYRGEALGRCRDANRQKFEELTRKGRVRALFSSQVAAIRPREVALTVGPTTLAVPNDYVLVCAGGELPLEFLNKMGVDVKRYHGQAIERREAVGRPTDKTKPMAPPRRRGLAQELTPEEKAHRRLSLGLFALGALIVAGLVVVGYPYYLLPLKARAKSPFHPFLKPAGVWGHGVGLAATGFMLMNFVYAIRKRWKLLKGTAPIRTWLTFHMFVGFMSPLVIAFHAAFQFNNQLATATTLSLLVVVGTGVIGRFVYGLVPTQGGTALEYAEVLGRWERLRARVEPLLEGLPNAGSLRLLFASVAADPKELKVSLPLFIASLPFEALRIRLRLLLASRAFTDRAHAAEFRESLLRLVRLRAQVRFYKGLKSLLGGWRVFHAVLAGLLVVLIAAHIAVTVFLGYRWIF